MKVLDNHKCWTLPGVIDEDLLRGTVFIFG
uniref:Uncharacterized protein n=1 Tax=Zea mays TaxID=4577 RepID=B4FCY1_MAIZE|nr:unknown [Zea mays]